MFGYVRADTPYLYIKDEKLYKAAYCGVCKAIGEVCGQSARMGLSYDVTFFSVLLHNISGEDLEIESARCLAHCIGRKRQMAKSDEMTRELGALNTVLAYLKYDDDVKDEKKGKGKRLWFKKGFARAKKKYPALTETVISDLSKQKFAEENGGTESVDFAADATATMLADVSDLILGEKKNEYSHNLFYTIGKWIYLTDALDDYDDDKKSGSYNPFVRAFKEENGKALLERHGKEIDFIFNSLFYDIRENAAGLKFHFNRDLTDNVLLRGLPAKTREIKEKLIAAAEKKEKNATKKKCVKCKKEQGEKTAAKEDGTDKGAKE